MKLTLCLVLETSHSLMSKGGLGKKCEHFCFEF